MTTATLRALLLSLPLWGTATATVALLTDRTWPNLITGLLLIPNVWLICELWTNIIDQWILEILGPAIEEEAGILARHWAHGTPPTTTTLWEEP